tara:strand:+ start:96 stop:1145 length:1050 start_codon:yes stop_codon:yes gene_type:complete
MPVKSFQPINPRTDVTTTRTFLHEVVPITGSIISGTYSDENIKNYTHGQFQSVYDYPYLSSSANHIFDLAVGYAGNSELSASANVQNSKKINMYNQFAQTLLGFTGSRNEIRPFESDILLDLTGAMKECFFVSFSRLLTKDQIKKNSFSIALGTSSYSTPFKVGAEELVLQDAKARVNGDNVANADGGDFAELFSNSAGTGDALGVVFYQAGIAVITASAFGAITDFAVHPTHGNQTVQQALTGSSITGSIDAFRRRIRNISLNNSTEINSTIYFCRAPANKFNYSSNPTYVDASKIRVKNQASDNPISYVTTVGLYNAQNELLAVAKLSEPLRKSIDNELTIRVRLDY